MDVPAKGNPFGRWVPARYVLALLGSIGMAIVYGLKVNLSVAIVAMLNHTAIRSAEGANQKVFKEECLPDDNVKNDVEADGPFAWSSTVRGVVLSCYFWGYLVSQIPGGRIAELVSAKWVMFFSVTINVVCTILTPVMAKWHYAAITVMRIGEGIGGGVTFPAMHVLLSKWAPPSERSVMAALVYAGTSLGTVISMLLSGVITYQFGWEFVFYIMGGLSCIWCVLWVVLVQDSPPQQPLISAEERRMIVTSLGTRDEHKEKRAVPWCAVLRSPAFLAILVAHSCSNWGWYMLLIELPSYMKQVLKFNMTQNAVSTAVPFFTLWIFSMLLSKTLDFLRSKNYITTTTARKIGTLFASVIPAICLLVLCYIGCNKSAAVILMGIGVTSIGGMFCGFLSNHIDIAPNYAGTLMALTNTVATIPGILVPIYVEHLTGQNPTIESWRLIFFVTIGLYAIEIVVYTAFGSGEEQWWNKPEQNNQNVENAPLNAELVEKYVTGETLNDKRS